MRLTITTAQLLPGMTLNGEEILEVVNNGAVWVRTEESDWWAPYRPDFQVHATV